MKRFDKLRRLLGHAADLTLITIEFIVAAWIILIPLGLGIYCYVRAWRATDAALPAMDRFNQVIHETFWINFLLLVLMVALRKFMYWAIKYSHDRQRDRERDLD